MVLTQSKADAKCGCESVCGRFASGFMMTGEWLEIGVVSMFPSGIPVFPILGNIAEIMEPGIG